MRDGIGWVGVLILSVGVMDVWDALFAAPELATLLIAMVDWFLADVLLFVFRDLLSFDVTATDAALFGAVFGTGSVLFSAIGPPQASAPRRNLAFIVIHIACALALVGVVAFIQTYMMMITEGFDRACLQQVSAASGPPDIVAAIELKGDYNDCQNQRVFEDDWTSFTYVISSVWFIGIPAIAVLASAGRWLDLPKLTMRNVLPFAIGLAFIGVASALHDAGIRF